MGNGYTEYDFRKLIESCVAEALAYKWRDVPADEREDWNVDSALEAMDYDGTFHEVADGCVPVYTVDIVETWLELNMPEGNDYGDVNEGEIVRQMMVGIYYWADAYAREVFEDVYNEVVLADLTTK